MPSATAAQPLKRPRPAPDAAPAAPSPRPRRARAASAPAAAPSPPLPPYRLEYGASGPPSSAALAAFLSRRRQHICGVHIANKDASDRLLERGEALLAAMKAEAAAATKTTTAAPPPPLPPVEVCLHYSLKLQGGRGDEAVRRLSSFLERVARLGGQQQKQGGTGGGGCSVSVLLVSGSGDPARRPKGQLCSAEALERLAAASPRPPTPPIYVAFNPYFPDAADRERERARLRRKLATGLLSSSGGGVALQFGADARLLEEGLAFLRRPDVLGGGGPGDGSGGASSSSAAPPQPTILGSVFLPTKRFLAAMRFRPWRGVFLKEGGFLESVEAAESCCAATLRLYRRYGVVPLVETALAVDEEDDEEEEQEERSEAAAGGRGRGKRGGKGSGGGNGLAAAEALLRLADG